MVALIVGQVTVTGSSPSLTNSWSSAPLMGEGHSCALHRDAFAVPRDIDRLGWNAVKLRERALDGFAVDVGLIHFPRSLHAVVDHDGDHDHGDGEC